VLKFSFPNKNRFVLFLLFTFVILLSFTSAQNKNIELVDIQFEGNEAFSNAILETVINSVESPGWLSKTLNIIGLGDEPVYFDSTLLQLDITALRNFYYDNGFFESKFEYDYIVDLNDKEAELFFQIEEGDRSLINSLMVSGTSELNPVFQKGISEIVEYDSTEFYNKQSLTILRADLSGYLKDKGMMLAEIELPRVLIDTLTNSVDVTININAGKRYNINEIRVEKTGEGSDLVEDLLIKNLVDINESDRYNASKLRSGQSRLYRTNLFNYALVTGVISDTSQNNVPLLISTNVGLLNEFTPEVIVNNEENVFNLGLSFGYTRKNFLGDARKINLTASTASQNILDFLSKPIISDTSVTGYADFRIRIEQPFLFGQPIYTTFETFLTLQKRRNQYNSTTPGGKLSFEFELPEKVYITSLLTYFNFENSRFLYADEYLYNAIYQFSKRDIFQNQEPTPEEEAELTFISDSLAQIFGEESFTTNNSLIGAQLSANKTNNFLFPTEGYSLSVNIENANLFPYLVSKIFNYNLEEPQYYRLRFTSTGFLQISPKRTSTLGAKFTVGNIQTYRGSKFRIPFNQRYASGGSNSIRGWGARELVTGKSDINFEELTPAALEALLLRGEPLGGYFILEGSFEWRQKFLDNLGFATFLDYGNTLFGPEDLKLNRLAVAFGFGFRYYSEIVPLRLDFGFKFYDPENRISFFKRNDIWSDAFQFHIGIGEAF
jgi:outer membrane protein insertion porin family